MGDLEHKNDYLHSSLIDEIICKVKSEGLFDQFRRECLADVDVYPAFQNLQHRVETSVGFFLNEQEWNSQMNKNQLRERLRKLIAEKRFFETGIERIVDQVINPKLNSNFAPKIGEVACKFLGMENKFKSIKLEINADVEPATIELEQLSPESELNNIIPSSTNRNHIENIGKSFDLESPVFEPIKPKIENHCLKMNEKNDADDIDDDDMDISDGDGISSHNLVCEIKSNLSSISSNNSNFEVPENDILYNKACESLKSRSAEISVQNTSKIIIENFNQDSILSQVSSSSRLSIVTDHNTNCHVDEVSIDDISEGDHMFSYGEETQMVTSYNNEELTGKCQLEKKQKNSNEGVVNPHFHQELMHKEKVHKSPKFEEIEDKNSFGKGKGGNENQEMGDMSNKNQISKQNQDDHYNYKEKNTCRQRSRSKDSNDGFTHSKINSSLACLPNQLATKNLGKNLNESDKNLSEALQKPEELIAQPVVVIDRLLNGNELDLETIIETNHVNHLIESSDAKIYKKTNKKIDLSNLQSIDKTSALKKQYMRTSDDQQGIELEFVCIENENGGIISNPLVTSSQIFLKPEHFRKLNTSNINAESLEKSAEVFSNDNDEFIGYRAGDIEVAKFCRQSFLEITIKNMKKTSKLTEQFFIDKSFVGNDVARKQKLEITNVSELKRKSPEEGNELIHGAEINNKKSKERQRKKTRYTEEDLFKPRSGLGRRRKI